MRVSRSFLTNNHTEKRQAGKIHNIVTIKLATKCTLSILYLIFNVWSGEFEISLCATPLSHWEKDDHFSWTAGPNHLQVVGFTLNCVQVFSIDFNFLMPHWWNKMTWKSKPVTSAFLRFNSDNKESNIIHMMRSCVSCKCCVVCVWEYVCMWYICWS